MEEAARKRLERLREFDLGKKDEILIEEFQVQDEEGENEKEGDFRTAESIARRMIAENTFVPEEKKDSEEQLNMRRANWDLKREYERRAVPLREKKREKIDKLLDERLDKELEDK